MPTVVPFSAFMARALYDPENGYYIRRIKTVGARGDFSTSATLSPVFGQATAGWLKQSAQEQPQVRHIIEIGAGTGALMAEVRKNMGWWKRRQFHWHIVETSPVLQKQQRELLGQNICWHQDLKTALNICEGRAFLYHNELLDAFPATLIQWHENAWHEVHIGADGREVWLPLDWEASERMAFHALQHWPTRQPKQRVELHPSVRQWMHSWALAWKAGTMLTVDYGDLFPALYHRRPAGTLRAYLHQQRLEGTEIYLNPGRQDITADINFSDYRAWAQELGWQEIKFGPQSELMQNHIKKINTDPKTNFILDAEGAGGAFKYVIHRIPISRK